MAAEFQREDLAFEGLKVVDLSQGVAGPHCGMLLALNGADVVKIEPIEGDWGRGIGRRWGDYSAYFVAFNRAKRSLALNLKDERGLGIVNQLVADADVVVENYRPGVLKRFGLDYDSVRERNPDVIYASITGFGQQGPNSGRPATDSILQSFSGLMTSNRDANGTPQRIGVLVIDVVTGLYAFQNIATSLYKRLSRGGGRHISVSLMESVGAVQAGKMIEFHLEGGEGQPPGVPVATFETQDGFITVNARRDQHFQSLCELLGLPELAADERFSTPELRAEHQDALMPTLRDAIAARQMRPLAAELEAHDILNAPVHDYTMYFDDPHVHAVSAIKWVEHLSTGKIPLHSIPGMEWATAIEEHVHSPSLGEHTDSVLNSLGLGPEDIARYRDEGVVT